MQAILNGITANFAQSTCNRCEYEGSIAIFSAEVRLKSCQAHQPVNIFLGVQFSSSLVEPNASAKITFVSVEASCPPCKSGTSTVFCVYLAIHKTCGLSDFWFDLQEILMLIQLQQRRWRSRHKVTETRKEIAEERQIVRYMDARSIVGPYMTILSSRRPCQLLWKMAAHMKTRRLVFTCTAPIPILSTC
jgi:hypothetical protein